jgi:hypothetical protein
MLDDGQVADIGDGQGVGVQVDHVSSPRGVIECHTKSVSKKRHNV